MKHRLKQIKIEKDKDGIGISSSVKPKRPDLRLGRYKTSCSHTYKDNKIPRLEHALHYQKEWNFIENNLIRENISYNIQYIECLIRLYNHNKIYHNIESLLGKTIILTIGSIVESALWDLIKQETLKDEKFKKYVIEKYLEGKEDDPDNKSNDPLDYLLFGQLIKLGKKSEMISRDGENQLFKLKGIRNLIHINSAEEREYDIYKPDQVNQFLDLLEDFREKMQKRYS